MSSPKQVNLVSSTVKPIITHINNKKSNNPYPKTSGVQINKSMIVIYIQVGIDCDVVQEEL
jgi:hypothetical protein